MGRPGLPEAEQQHKPVAIRFLKHHFNNYKRQGGSGPLPLLFNLTFLTDGSP